MVIAGWRADAAAQMTSASAAAAAANAPATLDLSDPKVRERLRAAGVDPEELQRLMGAKAGATAGNAGAAPPAAAVAPSATGMPTDATPLAPSQFPPVTPVAGRAPAFADSTRTVLAPVDSAAILKPFGYDLFTLEPATFEPLSFGPVSPDYLIGPGDEIIVSVWGAQELNTRAAVNRDGFVILPDVGQVVANGLTLGQFKSSLEKRLARIYSGISQDGRGRTSVEVSLGKLRSIQVFVLGDVKQPGGYTLSATSTIMNGLYFAGGPTPRGSLRNVRVTRANQVVHQADLYDYLTRGERSQDFKLESGDVVFVPPLTRRVTLEGEVRRPAIYEMRDGERLSDLLEIAGGLTSTAQRARIQVERIIPFEARDPLAKEDRKVIDVDLRAGGGETQILDGDIVRVFRLRDILKNFVKLTGTAVYRGGMYEHRTGLTVADLVDQAGGLLGEAYTGWAHLVRTHDDKTRELLSFDLAAALQRDPVANVTLQPRDEVQVFSVWDIRDPAKVTIEGLVRKPGVYDFLDGMTVTDLIVKAAGLRESAYRVRAEVSRIDPRMASEGKTAELIYVAMAESLRTDSDASRFRLQKNDIVFIREVPNWSLQENVVVTGEVKFPGQYSLTSKTERLSSVINRAGGLDETAYLQAATFVRRKDSTGRMAIDFEEALRQKSKRPSKYDLVLAAGDSIHIPREPKTVKVAGEVGFPSSVLWEDGRNLDYYLDQAGGLMSTADKEKISVLMASGRVERPSFFHKPEPDAGATIRVPVKPQEKERETLKNFAQIITILSGAATTIFLISRTGN
jgi:protein involved in polysaccharide export with SLBB domain